MFIIFLILMCSIAQADVYVLTDSNKEVIGISEQNDMVVPAGHKIDIVKNKTIKDLPFSPSEEKMYNFSGNKFSLNSKKVQDKNKQESDAILTKQKEDSSKKSGIEKLKDVVKLTDDEIEALFR